MTIFHICSDTKFVTLILGAHLETVWLYRSSVHSSSVRNQKLFASYKNLSTLDSEIENHSGLLHDTRLSNSTREPPRRVMQQRRCVWSFAGMVRAASHAWRAALLIPLPITGCFQPLTLTNTLTHTLTLVWISVSCTICFTDAII